MSVENVEHELFAKGLLADKDHTLVNNSEGAATAAGSGAVGVVPVTKAIATLTSTGTDIFSLANGVKGQILVITHGTDGGQCNITPVTATGWVTALLLAASDTISLLYVDDTVGWVVLGTTAAATLPLITV